LLDELEASKQSRLRLVMDTERYRYRNFCSDLAGIDIEAHSGDILELVRVVRNCVTGYEPTKKWKRLFHPGITFSNGTNSSWQNFRNSANAFV
jgi:hypothetical protein